MSSSVVVRLPSPARDRVICVTNVRFAADSKTLEELFESYAIQDQHRTTNTRIGTKSVVYVLFATVADKIRSFELSGSMLFDREIKIQPAPQGNYTLNNNETAFVRPVKGKGKKAAAAAGPSNNAPVFDKCDFPVLGIPQENETPKSVPATPLTILEAFNTSIESIEAALTEALKDMELNTDQHDVGKKQSSEHQKAEHNVVAGKANELQARIAELEKSLASAKADLETAQKDAAAKDVSVKATKPASAKAHTLSSIIAQRKAIYTQNEEGSASEGSNPVRGPPPNVSMAIPPTYNIWNLNGHDPYDRSKNVITPSDWYGFQAQQAAKTEQEQETQGTNLAQIIAENGKGAKGSKRNGKK